MASSEKNLSTYSNVNLSASLGTKKVAIVVSEWNTEITEALYEGAYSTLIEKGLKKENIIKKYVPGSFELSIGAQKMAALKDIDAVICVGCVIRGETSHFDFICQAVATGITEVSLKYDKPVIFGVLTTENKQQAFDRAGGKHGNKGDEAGITAVKMINF
ncbi:MAG: 6,7-dimethyl-8-ribityllumazine synthase [Cytophagaceae bacterium]|jgi:6,7-dimethyl-8-ribityllumazine synthase|nr:6,7-dimethyl-8-ribityllumazine synthase [Cytophagaceae bacterium]